MSQSSGPAITRGNIRPISITSPLPAIAKGGFSLSLSVQQSITPHVTPKQPRWARPTPDQLAVMSKIVQESDDLGGVADQIESFDERFVTNPGPEWVFHGTMTDWDTLHAAGGFQPTGDNTSISDHFHSSATHLTAYVSTSRYLPTAAVFAQKTGSVGFGYIYLIYITDIGVVGNARQAEVAIPGSIPMDNVFMFRFLGQDTMLYQNVDFRLATVTPTLIQAGIRLLGGV